MNSEVQNPEATEVTATATDSTPITAADRCDSCGAQAYVRATLQFGELLFCLHHATLNKTALEPVLVHWHDESERLLTR